MDERSARALVEELRAELARADVSDPEKRARLERLVQNLDDRLEGDIDEQHHEIVGDLREEAVEFAVEHPDLAATLRGFMRMLSSIGI